MNPLYLLDPQAVAFSASATRAQVLADIARHAAMAYALDEVQVAEALAEREALGSTGFGGDVALPHARIPGLSRPVATFLRLEEPVDWSAADGMPVSIAFGLLSPEASGAAHLHALAAISRSMRDEAWRTQLLGLPDAESLYAALAEVTDRDAA
jgi:PTS system nitrogen regulatory IIA component